MFIMGVGNHNNCKSEKVGGVEAVLGATFIFYLCNLFMGAVLTKLIWIKDVGIYTHAQ